MSETISTFLSRGLWNEALEIAKRDAPTRQAEIYYALGKRYEIEENDASATKAYEQAGVHVREVPRMLLKAKKSHELETYVRTCSAHTSKIFF